MKTCCSNCGQVIENVVFIKGKPYGTTCGARLLGFKDFPTWFKGGDWDKAREEHVKSQEERNRDFERRREITRNHWEIFVKLSQAHLKSRRECNEWLQSFLSSIADRLELPNITHGTDLDRFTSFEDAVANWPGSFPYMNREPRSIDELSDKQQEILTRYI